MLLGLVECGFVSCFGFEGFCGVALVYGDFEEVVASNKGEGFLFRDFGVGLA